MIDNKHALSIVIPVYNEERRIRDTIVKIKDYFNKRGVSYEIIVVDDGSTDKSLQVIREVCSQDVPHLHFLHNMKNMGKGFSVKRGMLFARGDIILFTDADLSVPIEEYEKFERAIRDGYDVAIGSRGLKDSKKLVAQGFLRDRLGKLFGKIVKIMLLPDIDDSQCGFKVFKREAAHFLFYWQTIYGFGFDPEILYLARRHNYKYTEIPVIWINSFDSKLKVMKDTFRIGFELFKVKLKSILGHYSI